MVNMPPGRARKGRRGDGPRPRIRRPQRPRPLYPRPLHPPSFRPPPQPWPDSPAPPSAARLCRFPAERRGGGAVGPDPRSPYQARAPLPAALPPGRPLPCPSPIPPSAESRCPIRLPRRWLPVLITAICHGAFNKLAAPQVIVPRAARDCLRRPTGDAPLSGPAVHRGLASGWRHGTRDVRPPDRRGAPGAHGSRESYCALRILLAIIGDSA
jgi:hypothetical protein